MNLIGETLPATIELALFAHGAVDVLEALLPEDPDEDGRVIGDPVVAVTDREERRERRLHDVFGPLHSDAVAEPCQLHEARRQTLRIRGIVQADGLFAGALAHSVSGAANRVVLPFLPAHGTVLSPSQIENCPSAGRARQV